MITAKNTLLKKALNEGVIIKTLTNINFKTHYSTVYTTLKI